MDTDRIFNNMEQIETESRKNLEKMTQHDKLNSILITVARMDEHIDGINGSIKDHEKRLRWLEPRMWAASGGLGVLGLLLVTKQIGLW